MERLDESADGREVELKQGQEFELTLDENPSTGFRWRLTSDGSPQCAPAGDEFRAPDEARPGQGGSRVWQFRAVQAGVCRIALSYARAGGDAARDFQMRVRVT